ncbi:MAG: hypothetical protein RIA69_01945 [Cyclobacteriaceae bacterium]
MSWQKYMSVMIKAFTGGHFAWTILTVDQAFFSLFSSMRFVDKE